MDMILSWLHKIRWTLLLSMLLLVPLLVDTQIGSLGPESKFRMLEMGALLALLLSLPIFIFHRTKIQINVINISIAATVGYVFIRAWFDPYQSYALDTALQQSSWLLFILLTASVCQTPGQFRQFLWIAIPIQMAAMVYACGQIYGVDIYANWILGKDWYWYNENIDSKRGLIYAPLGQPNYYANYGAVVLLFLLTLLLQARRFWQRGILFLLIGFLFYTLMYTFTRGIWVSVFPAVGLICGIEITMQFIQNRSIRANAWSYLKPAAAVLLLGFVLLGIYTSYEMYRGDGPLHHIGKRFYHGISFRDTSMRTRPLFWYAALRMWKESPAVGKGLGQYEPRFLESVYQTSQEYDAFTVHEITKQMSTLRAGLTHNDYLHTLSEQGIMGLALLLLFIMASAFTAFYILYYSSLPPPDRITLLGCVIIVAQTAVQLIYDFPLHLPASAMFFGVAVAGIVVYARLNPALQFSFCLPFPLRVFVTILSLPLIVYGGMIVQNHFKASHLRNQGVTLINQFSAMAESNKAIAVRFLSDAEEHLLVAHELFPDNGEILHELGRAHYFQYNQNPDFYYPKLKQARASFEQSQQTFNAPETIDMLCTVYVEEQRFDAARILSDKLIAIDPTREEVQYFAGVIDFKAGDFSKAVQHFQNELTSNPEHSLSMIYLARSLIGLHQFHAAADAFERFLAKNPGWIEPRRLLAELYANQLQDYIKARNHYQTALEMAGGLQEPQRRIIMQQLNDGLQSVQSKITQELNTINDTSAQ